MPMQTFNFPYHSIETVYPSSSQIVQFGRGYRFATKPRGPDQIVWNLTFPSMKWYLNSDNSVNLTTNPTRNVGKLEEFYNIHRLHEYFLYPHQTRGDVRVRFTTPLIIPVAALGGSGEVPGIKLSLIYEP